MKETTRLMSLASMGLEMAISVGIGTWLGIKFDDWAGTSPIGILVGILIGVCAGFWRLFVFLRLLERNRKQSDDNQAGEDEAGKGS